MNSPHITPEYAKQLEAELFAERGRRAELESDLGYLSTAVGTGFLPDQSDFHDDMIARRAIRAANAHKAVGERDALIEMLRGILNSGAGKQVLYALSQGQSTDTDEGKLWLKASELCKVK